ncbi:leucine-rich repeat- and IQ domain-containing protein 1 isoform X1 [Scyliorhinus torazame]|uniref:leucine-rich repeat- and IQ domain-containing protein 1 isoform X1 n=3 Tax=Scyliorhinus torazame TaxID=75743 RepID=UPI003B58C961
MDEDQLIEEAIEAELRQINISPSELDELKEQSDEDIPLDTDYDSDELPNSVFSFLEQLKQRGEIVEKLILQDLKQAESDAVYPTHDYRGSEMLIELAAEFGEDHLNLKEKILAQIEEEEQRIQTHKEPQQNTEPSFHVETTNPSLGDETISGHEEAITRACREVEERCQLSLKQWEIEQGELQKIKLAELMEQQKLEKELAMEEEERAKSRQQQFEDKLEKLAEERQKQQAKLEKKIRQEQDALERELKQHEALIQSMQNKVDGERRIFEEQQSKERARVKELQNRAATTIQARFRAHLVRKKHAPILKERRNERKRKKDLQLRMAQEKRQFEEKIKRKLEQKRKEEEEEGRKQEEVKRLQREEQKQRQIEYEKKKEQERQRLEKERQLKLEEFQKVQEEIKRKELERKKREEKQEEAERQKAEERKLLEEEKSKMALKQRKKTKIEKKGEPQLTEEGSVNSKINKNKEAEQCDHSSDNICVLFWNENIGLPQNIQENNLMNDSKVGSVNSKINKNKDAEQCDNSSENVCALWNENLGLSHNIQENNLMNGSNVVRECTALMTTGTNLEMKFPAEEVVESTAENIFVGGPSITIPKSLLQINNECAVMDRNPSRLSDEGISVLNTSDGNLHMEDLTDVHEIVELVDLNFEKSFLATGLTLPDHIEQKRLNWMKMCTPWSRISRENKAKKVNKQIRLRNNPVNQLPPLSPDVILQSGVWTSLQQVTTITLQDLPGFSLSTFSQCLRLKSLTLRNCGLATLEGVNNCKGLKYIDVQENNIRNIHCLELENLCILLLSHNQITSIHGLENCSNLQVLELSHNNITRIGGLESLKKLQRLAVDHNQLISTKRLSATPTLLYLDCSFNYLDSLEGIDNCGLLQSLKLQNNNLSELPKFGNHVLLRELYLDDNTISSLNEMSEYWLPMLQHLSVSQNSLTHLTTMSNLPILERLNVSNNRLSDLKSFLLSLDGCNSLLELSLDGNPLQQESDWRCSILKMLPSLKIVDGERICSSDDLYAERHRGLSPGSFLALCQAQLQNFELLLRRHETELELDSLDITETRCQCCEELMQLAEECRYAHEYGELCLTEEKKHPNSLHEEELNIGKQCNKLTISLTKENSQNSDTKVVSDPVQTAVTYTSENRKQSDYVPIACQDSEHCDPRLIANQERTAISLQDFRTRKGPIHSEYNRKASEPQNKESLRGKLQQHISEDNLENYAATVLQSHWRGYCIRRQIHIYMVLHNAASVIQSAWRDYNNRMKVASQNTAEAPAQKWKMFDGSEESRHRAVTIIQAYWRGCLLRKKLAYALAAVQTEEEDIFEAVDLSEFTFDEATLDKVWVTSDPETSSQNENRYQQIKTPAQNTADPFALPRHRQQAWQDDINTVEKFGSPSFSPATTSVLQSPSRTVSRFSEATSCSKQCFKSEKEEQISLEWGFKDAHTAQLMLKRAQKMKSKKAEAKKLLDPVVRLALFKNKKNKYSPVKPKKKTINRVEYFRAPKEFIHQDTTSAETLQKSRELTYQWLHTQLVNDEQTKSRIMKNLHFLPELDAEVLNGGRVQLMASHVGRECSDLDVVSVTSGSTINQPNGGFNYRHWHSSGSTIEATVPLKTDSKPLKQERISFRNNRVRLSTGWGSGKKRGKTL